LNFGIRGWLKMDTTKWLGIFFAATRDAKAHAQISPG